MLRRSHAVLLGVALLVGLTVSAAATAAAKPTVTIGTKNFTERYFRDEEGWLKVSARGRIFRMTAEQVLNHILPALARVKPGLTIKVDCHVTAREISAI